MGSYSDPAIDGNFGQRLLHRIKTFVYAAPKNHANAAQLRVGLIGGDIPVFPPLAFILTTGGAFLSWYVSGNQWRYLPPGLASSITLRSCLGIVMVMGAQRLAKACRNELGKSGTKPNFQPVQKVCDTGPYRYGRNFMYVSVLIIPVAGSIALDTAWLLYWSLLLGAYLHFLVIPAEEKLLRNEFGKTYEEYSRRVPRWFWIF